MQSRALRAIVLVALVAAAAILFVALRDDGGETERVTRSTKNAAEEKNGRPEPRREVTSVVVKGGEPVGGVAELEYERGDRVRFDVKSDVAEEVHVHGYDAIEDVGPGKVARFDFPADIEGGFEVELEGAHTKIAELTVEPR